MTDPSTENPSCLQDLIEPPPILNKRYLLVMIKEYRDKITSSLYGKFCNFFGRYPSRMQKLIRFTNTLSNNNAALDEHQILQLIEITTINNDPHDDINQIFKAIHEHGGEAKLRTMQEQGETPTSCLLTLEREQRRLPNNPIIAQAILKIHSLILAQEAILEYSKKLT